MPRKWKDIGRKERILLSLSALRNWMLNPLGSPEDLSISQQMSGTYSYNKKSQKIQVLTAYYLCPCFLL